MSCGAWCLALCLSSLPCWYGVAGTAPSGLADKTMRLNLRYVLVAILRVGVVQASNFESALDLIMRYHGKDAQGLSNTLDTLTHIATKLRDEPEDPRYRSIRILNKTFWERVGSVNGGISFMSALGFDLVEQDAGKGPSFQTRPGAPVDADLVEALEVLSAQQAAPPKAEELTDDEQRSGEESTTPAVEDKSDFNPFTTAFSRKSHTHLQERAEQGLAHFTERQARRQQRFSRIEDRNITILLPQTSSQQEVPDASGSDSAETEKSEDMQQHELEIVAQLWRDRMAHDDIERFETAAAKKLRLLRASKVYSYVILRVRLPGGVFLQGRFSLRESLKTVYDVVGASLALEAASRDNGQEFCNDFELFMAPPTRVLARDDASLKDSNVLAPACVLHLRWTSEEADVESWAERLEESMKIVTDSAVHPRLPFSSRYDVPAAISPKPVQDSTHGTGAGGDSRADDEDAASPAVADELPESPSQ